MRAFPLLILAAAPILFSNCQQTFEPKGVYTPMLVVDGILDERQQDLIVRVSHTYNPPGYDPTEYRVGLSIPGARVTLDGGSLGSWALAETTLSVSDIHGNTSMSAYVLRNADLEGMRRYTLTVEAAGYQSVSASTVMPKIGGIGIEAALSEDSTLVNTGYIIYYTPQRDPSTKGVLARLWIRYLAPDPDHAEVMTPDSLEVPSSTQVFSGINTPVYPRLDRVGADAVQRASFTLDAAQYALEKLKGSRPNPGSIQVKGLAFHLILLDRPAYDYYLITHGFNDPLSVRTDQPDYSNVQGGLGFFGAVAAGDVAIRLPHSLVLRYKLTDAQL